MENCLELLSASALFAGVEPEESQGLLGCLSAKVLPVAKSDPACPLWDKSRFSKMESTNGCNRNIL